ncbi:MerR family transcriptional regulator [Cellulomonas dongxiuzhuiae]|uniref:MerR family transcriptional regulator n=1 Tax=Cellulomonas dongxiuzhuiae TaxID=2819979 RepID=A0ABX8GMG4_9CELL|nr:MerR family transcriptional regulator [Cellulomonas dongxiuzhuiae]MBO3095447.1 MerR family transcriptional regulator [Cellulomonas dongxiuzhuiae]QWC16429.1 MerR family transcriptional regulator [Cellulomonas dongxiuzhuiae]
MWSIGEIAHSTGVSRRMLRHWEQVGLLEPASTDGATGYRRYAPSQVGRVRAVASLRALGFGLDTVADLLDATLTEQRLVELLREREQALVADITEASARLAEVRARLASFEKGARTVMSTLELVPLPALRLCAVQDTVRDETEIPEAARRLLALLPRDRGPGGDGDVVLLFDGTSDDAIVVTAGTPAGAEPCGLPVVEVAAVAEGVSVTFDERPADVADAWTALDAALESRGLRAAGVYRQVNAPGGAVTLQAGVRQRT